MAMRALLEHRHGVCGWRLGLLLACFLVPAALAPDVKADDEPARWDLVRLKNGNTQEGRVIEDNAEGVLLRKTNAQGGFSEVRLPRNQVRQVLIEGGSLRKTEQDAARVRSETFLLQREGVTLGTRRLDLWRLKRTGLPGFRLEEELVWFAQGPHVPAARSRRVEITDARFHPTRLLFSETVLQKGGAQRRTVAGQVVDGVCKVTANLGGERSQLEIPFATDVYGRLGLREHLLRSKRTMGLHRWSVFDVEQLRVVQVSAGFTRVESGEARIDAKTGRPPHDELVMEEGDLRLVAELGADGHAQRESVSADVYAVPAAEVQLEVAERQARGESGTDAEEVALASAAIAFKPPDATWVWKPRRTQPISGRWRVLGVLYNNSLVADARFELHQDALPVQLGHVSEQKWLVDRLRGAAKDLEIVGEPGEVPNLPGSWRLAMRGTLKGDAVYTVAIVAPVREKRLVILIACPAAAWKDGRAAIERLIASLRPLG